MSKLLLLGFVFLSLTLIPTAGFCEEATLLCSYSLDQTAADQTGNFPDVLIINAPFEDGGIYLNGNYIGSDPDSSLVQTPDLTTLDFNSFSVSVDFKVGELPVGLRPILIGGSGWRWIGASLTNDGELILNYNSIYRPHSAPLVTVDTWYTIAMIYDGTTGYLYLDGVQVDKVDYTLQHGGDRNFLTHHGGNGIAFKGHIRNLEVYNGVADALPVEQKTLGDIKALYR